MKKVIITLSGGMDSATVLAKAIAEGRECLAISFDYGSKHNVFENAKAKQLARHYNVPFKLIDLKTVMAGFKSNLMMDGGDIPEGHYEDESMSLTVVPSRNIIFLSILSGLAWSNECSEVWIGIHAGDHAVYPDCRPEFYWKMNEAIQLGTDHKVSLHAPFLHNTKTDILKTGLELKVPYDLTRTCYKHQQTSCGKCGSCVERLEAFKTLGKIDPIEYTR